MSSLFILEHQLTIEDISIFSNSGHLKWVRSYRNRNYSAILAGENDRVVTIVAIGHNFEKDPPKNHNCQFLLNFVFREEGLNVKFYDGTTDGCQVIAKVHIAFDLLNSVQDLLLLDSSNRTRPTRCRPCRYRNRKRSGGAESAR